MIQLFWFYMIISLYYIIGVIIFTRTFIINRNKKIYFIDATPLLENKSYNDNDNDNYI